ncbi:phosphoethanolamine transferase [Ectothiorhodospiraceae bacterium BW-2]|nr:phosphoethanolamine transferase [Ectothiorhodospiraceae bacterium BW-2]
MPMLRQFTSLQRPQLYPASILLLVTLVMLLLHNHHFWYLLSQRIDLATLNGFGYLLTLLGLMLLLMLMPLLLLASHFWLKPLLTAVILVSALLSYFSDRYGTIFDVEMVRNIIANVAEGNRAEALELLSVDLFSYLSLYALPPLALMLLLKVKSESWHRAMLRRLFTLLILLGATLLLVGLNYKTTTLFSRENRDLRVYIQPIYAISSVVRYYHQQWLAAMPFTPLEPAVSIRPDTATPLIAVMVVGETGRADHWSLNGYPRATTPGLAQTEGVVNFSQTRSCGTTTAYSLPCMFSLLPASDYSPEKAERRSNVLDLIQNAAIDTYWIDNNSGCKGICQRLNAANRIQLEPQQLDQQLLPQLAQRIVRVKTDTLFVLHMLGSHGPAYYRRYPQSAEQFSPVCRSQAPHTCSREEITNAYDNTIVYTDRFLTQLIQQLQQQPYPAFMLYASDHGESLGENGIYLHGLPYAIAPEAQTHVPMVLWASDSYRQLRQLPPLPRNISANLSHDVIAHTLLGGLFLHSRDYDAKLDLWHHF